MDSKQITLNQDEELANFINEVLGGTGESFCVYFVDNDPERKGKDSHVIRMKVYIPKKFRRL